MTTRELLKLVEGRGLKLGLVEGRPVLLRAAGNPAVTDKLLAVLRIHRERIVRELSTPAAATAAG
jgi:hypothetical protein